MKIKLKINRSRIENIIILTLLTGCFFTFFLSIGSNTAVYLTKQHQIKLMERHIELLEQLVVLLKQQVKLTRLLTQGCTP